MATATLISRKGRLVQSNAVKGKGSKRYNPNKIRRRVRFIELDASGIAHLASYSMTRAGKKHEHKIHVDLNTTECICSCENFFYTRSKQTVKIANAAERGCKHIKRALGTLRQRELIPAKLTPVTVAPQPQMHKCQLCNTPMLEHAGAVYCFVCE